MQQTHEMKRSQPIVDKIIQLNYKEVPHKSLSINLSLILLPTIEI